MADRLGDALLGGQVTQQRLVGNRSRDMQLRLKCRHLINPGAPQLARDRTCDLCPGREHPVSQGFRLEPAVNDPGARDGNDPDQGADALRVPHAVRDPLHRGGAQIRAFADQGLHQMQRNQQRQGQRNDEKNLDQEGIESRIFARHRWISLNESLEHAESLCAGGDANVANLRRGELKARRTQDTGEFEVRHARRLSREDRGIFGNYLY
jgi:hypothetical protein